MTTNKDQTSLLTNAPAADVNTPLKKADTTATGAPQTITMDESTCHPYVKEGAERTALGLTGGGIGFGMSALCGGPSAFMAAIGAGLCVLGGKSAANCCFSKCDNSADNLHPVEPRAFAINMTQ